MATLGFLSLLTELEVKQTRRNNKVTFHSHSEKKKNNRWKTINSAVLCISSWPVQEVEDLLANYPKVVYKYKMEEVAFLYIKMKQFIRRHQHAKVLVKDWASKSLQREKDLAKINENCQKALDNFHMELSEMKKLETKMKDDEEAKGQFYDLIDNLVLETRLKHRKFEDVRKEMAGQFEKVCSEEIKIVNNIIGIFFHSLFECYDRKLIGIV